MFEGIVRIWIFQNQIITTKYKNAWIQRPKEKHLQSGWSDINWRWIWMISYSSSIQLKMMAANLEPLNPSWEDFQTYWVFWTISCRMFDKWSTTVIEVLAVLLFRGVLLGWGLDFMQAFHLPLLLDYISMALFTFFTNATILP